MPLAARALIDQHVCPMVDGVKPHVGGPVTPPCSLTVQSELAAQGRGTDRATCIGPPDFIVTGSGSVQVNDLPAARQTDKTMHGGTLLTGAPTVEIGGPTGGVTLGNPTAATATCNAMRPPGARSPRPKQRVERGPRGGGQRRRRMREARPARRRPYRSSRVPEGPRMAESPARVPAPRSRRGRRTSSAAASGTRWIRSSAWYACGHRGPARPSPDPIRALIISRCTEVEPEIA